jgi:uncharacterized UPF0160 family protein
MYGNNGILIVPENCWINSYILSQIDPQKKLYFTIYKKGENYGFSAVQNGKFKNRVDLMPYSTLSVKYADLIFIHKNLFCGESNSLWTAQQVCQESINQYKLRRNVKIGTGVVLGGGLLYILKKMI